MIKKIGEYYNSEIKEIKTIDEFMDIYKSMRKYLSDEDLVV